MEHDFFSKLNFKNSKPKAGKVLISEPFLADPYFKRTVVFLVEHTREGSVGFILNKPVNILLSDVVSDFPNTRAEVYFGGPVNQNNLFFLHTYGGILSDSRHVKDGIYWGGNFDQLKFLVENKQISIDNFRFFAGYSGWSKNQLSDELKEKSWIVSDIDVNKILEVNPKQFWKDLLKAMGSNFEIMSKFPEDPSMN